MMKKEKYIQEIKEILLIDQDEKINNDTPIHIDSMASLLIIAFFDENFSKKVSSEDIKRIKSIDDFIGFIGESNLE